MRKNLSWPDAPKAEPNQVTRHFVGRLKGLVGVLHVWAEIQGHTLRLTTLIEDNKEIEHLVYDAERDTHAAFDNASIEFEVIRRGEWLPPDLERALTVYAAK